MGPQQNNSEKLVNISPENGINFNSPNIEGNLLGREKDMANVEVSTSNTEQLSQQVNDALSTTEPSAVVIPPILPTVNDSISGSAQSSTSSHPKVAEDVDLIEKEWVDRAKKIISETQNEPHLRDKQVTELRESYKNKRYSKGDKALESV